MNHYFSQDNEHLKSVKKHVYVDFLGKRFDFLTDHGVFSKSGLDFGSRCLLETIIDQASTKALDLGSGYGPIGIIYKHFHADASVYLVEINPRAASLSKENAALNQVDVTVYNQDSLSGLDKDYDLIITNPPIRAGKQTVYRLFEDAKAHLVEQGTFFFVMHKKHGALSAMKKCQTLYPVVEIVDRRSGYHVIRCIK